MESNIMGTSILIKETVLGYCTLMMTKFKLETGIATKCTVLEKLSKKDKAKTTFGNLEGNLKA